MNIFEPVVGKGYEWVNTCNDDDYEVFWSLDGQSRAADWKPIRVTRVRADERKDFKQSDFPWLGSHALVLSKPAVEALADIMAANGELLPLIDAGGMELFVFNARVVDALDEKRSRLVRFPGTQQIMRVDRHSLVPEVVAPLDIFRLPHKASPTYVSERFIERVRSAELRGLVFNRVWTNEYEAA
jgi:hypothetical protein